MGPLVWTVVPIIVSIISFAFLFITKWFDPNAERFGYPFDVSKRVADLISVVEEIKEIKDDVCRLNQHSAWERERGWIRRVHIALENAHQVKLVHDENKSNLFRNFSVARESDIQAKYIRNLIAEGRQLLDSAIIKPLPVRCIVPQGQQHLIGMDSIIKQVFDFVAEYDSTTKGILGICGTCGTGKTSVLKLVRDSCAQATSYDFVIFAVATYDCSIPKLQQVILASLGLNTVMLDEESSAAVIFNILKDKSFLLLLDNLWIRADLEKIGIPMPLVTNNQLRRKVIFTTRSCMVCADMECSDHYITLGCLSAADAWRLFTEKVGNDIIYSHPRILHLAREVVAACGGLPVALCTVGRLMSLMKDQKYWWAAVQCLKKSGIIEILESDSDMFHSLKISYDHLEEKVRDCFLVCSLFKKGENISRDRLLNWWTGLGLLDVKDASTKGHLIITTLLAVCLLEKGDNDHRNSEHSCLKVHPILHDMSLRIVRECKKDWIPLSNFSLSNCHEWKNLSFLDLSSLSSMSEFPKAICSLVKLQYLNISGTKISYVPSELVYLSEMKFLYLRQMEYLRRIPCWAISRLKNLQVLDLFFDVTAFLDDTSIHRLPFTESPGRAYASSLLLELIRSDVHLQVFSVCVHTAEQVKIVGCLPRAHVRSLAIDNIAQKADGQVGDDELGKMNLHHLCEIENLTELSITRCYFVKEVIAEGDLSCCQSGLFSNLEYLHLGHVEKITWRNAGLNLRVVCFFECKFTHASWLQQLPSLVEIKIIRCPLMVLLVDSTMLSDDWVRNQAIVTFPHVEKLTLQRLPELSSLSDIDCEFAKLSYLQIHVCNKLKALCLHPHHNQTTITIWCFRNWWYELEWHSEAMKTFLIPMCSMKGTCLNSETYGNAAVGG